MTVPRLKTHPALDSPLYWFAVLKQAIDQSDYERAAEAQRNLRRLGVEVRIHPTQQEAADAS